MVFPWFADGSATLGHSQNGGAARAHHRPRRGCGGELGAGRDAGAALGAQVRGPNICRERGERVWMYNYSMY